MERYFMINKPRGIVSQFVSTHQVGLLGDLSFAFPEGTHAIGRLDKDSEGLLLLTTDKRITRLLFLDRAPHRRSYLVMVQNEMSEERMAQLREGIVIKVQHGATYLARPEHVDVVTDPLALYPFADDHRMQYAHTWLRIILTEGKYRQVRKMMLATHHRCLRLVRLSISNLTLGNLAPGEVKELDAKTFYELLDL